MEIGTRNSKISQNIQIHQFEIVKSNFQKKMAMKLTKNVPSKEEFFRESNEMGTE